MGRVARMGERRGAYRVLVRKPGVNRPLGIPRHKWVDCSKVDLIKEIGLGGGRGGRNVDWIYLAHDRARRRARVNGEMNFRIQQNPGISGTSCGNCSFHTRTLLHRISYVV